MAGFPFHNAVVARPSEKESDSEMAISEEWEIQLSRLICFPTINFTTNNNNNNLRPLCPYMLNRLPRGTWLSSSSPSFLQLLHHSSSSDFILSVRLRDMILEEHYLSKLHFSWPQVSCISGFPARGTRTIFASYTDSAGEIQKFAMRFSTTYEAGSFVNILMEILKDERDIQPISSDFGSLSTHSELLSSNRLSDSL